MKISSAEIWLASTMKGSDFIYFDQSETPSVLPLSWTVALDFRKDCPSAQILP